MTKPLIDLQREFLQWRFGMFMHFNMATFQDREWGDPKGEPALFDPTDLDTDQWAEAAKTAGMGYGCLTAKHHDGFPIWHTKTGVVSTLDSPRKLDVVRRYVDSFRKAGLKVGLYYSILDLRNDIRHFNITPEKIRLIEDQLTELLTEYGQIDLLIFDGWDAPWSRITYEEIPFRRIYDLVKRLQPNCLISELNASQYPPQGLYYTDIKAFEQNAGQFLPDTNALPSQACVTLTDGWFWKTGDENRPLKSVAQVVDEWLVPQNARHCNLICNAAPDRTGRLHPVLVQHLAKIGRTSKPLAITEVGEAVQITTPNLAAGRPTTASSSEDTVGPDQAVDGDYGTGWKADIGDSKPWIEIGWDEEIVFDTITVVEPRGRWAVTEVSATFSVSVWTGSKWHPLLEDRELTGFAVHRIPQTTGTKLGVEFSESRVKPSIAEIGVYRES